MARRMACGRETKNQGSGATNYNEGRTKDTLLSVVGMFVVLRAFGTGASRKKWENRDGAMMRCVCTV